MADLRLESVPCYEHFDIQDESLPVVPERFPFSKEFFDQLAQACPVVVEFPEVPLESEDESDVYNQVGYLQGTKLGLRRITPEHGRSYEIFVGDPEKVPQLIWEDEYGNEYSSLSIKGANFARPRIRTSLTAPSGYIPHGLLETDAFLRVVRASRIMREAGICTEMIVKVLEPQYLRYNKLDAQTGESLPDEYEYVPQVEFKRRLLQDHWKKMAGREGAIDEFEKVSTAINAMSYFFTVRAMGLGARIKDFVTLDTDVLRHEVGKVFNNLNARIDPKAQERQDGLLPLSAAEDEHIARYALHLLPQWIGENLGRMHRLGLVHTFPWLGNITVFGDLIDLDSVRGEPLNLGDAPVTEDDFQTDLDQVMGHLFEHAHESQALYSIIERNFGTADTDKKVPAAQVFKANLLHTYAAARFKWPDEAVTTQTMDEQRFFADLPKIEGVLSTYVDINSTIIEELLESAFGTATVPDLMDVREFTRASEEYNRWVRKALPEYLYGEALAFLRDTSLTAMHPATGEWFFHTRINGFMGEQATTYRYEQFIKDRFADPAFKEMLQAWVQEHKSSDCSWSDEGLYTLVEKHIYYKTMTDLNSMCYSMGLGRSSRIDLFPTSVMDYDYVASYDAVKVLANGKLLIVRDEVSYQELIENMDAELHSQSLDVIHEGGKQTRRLQVEVPAGYSLAEVLTDGQLEAVNIDELTDDWKGQAKVEIVLKTDSSYFAYALLNQESGKVSLYVVR